MKLQTKQNCSRRTTLERSVGKSLCVVGGWDGWGGGGGAGVREGGDA